MLLQVLESVEELEQQASGAGNAVGALGNSIAGVFGADTDELNKSPLQKILDFAKESESIILVSDKIDSLLNSFDRLAGMESILETSASALQKFGVALASFGAGNGSWNGKCIRSNWK